MRGRSIGEMVEGSTGIINLWTTTRNSGMQIDPPFILMVLILEVISSTYVMIYRVGSWGYIINSF